MPMLVHLVRHASHAVVGTTLVARAEGVGLSEAGRSEARALAGRLRGASAQRIETSPLERCVQTADILAEHLGLETIAEPLLLELDAGAWTGRRFADLDEDPSWVRWNRGRAFAAVPGGETAFALQARMAAFLAGVAARGSEGGLIAVSHAEPIRMLVLAVLGLGPDAWPRIAIDPASVTTLAVDEAAPPVLVRLNERPSP